jgi:hypothetical protein
MNARPAPAREKRGRFVSFFMQPSFSRSGEPVRTFKSCETGG